MVDRAVIQAKVAVIQTRLKELKTRLQHGITAKQLAEDSTVQAVILHHYQVIIQACGDIGSHIVKSIGRR